MGWFLAALNLVLYGGLAYLGIGFMRSVAASHGAAYITTEHVAYYVGFPAFVVVLTIGLVGWARVRRRPIARWPLVVTLLLLVPYMLAYTGGI